MISIVMAYYNRKPQLLRTLESIYRLMTDIPFEIIVVDDASNPEHKLKDIKDIKLIEIPLENKTWVNPCIPFNIGFKEAKGEKIIIQNPECMYNGNVLQYVEDNLNDSNYLSFGCYSISQNWDGSINNRTVRNDGDSGWYNHSTFRPVAYHFCSAITKKNLDELGGFDERFANGIAYDDDEFLFRIRKKGLNVNIINEPFVFHQWHYNTSIFNGKNSNLELFNKIKN